MKKFACICAATLVSVLARRNSADAAEPPKVRTVYVAPCNCADQFNYGFGDGRQFGSGYGWGVGHGFGTGYGYGVGFGFNGGSAGGYSAGNRLRSNYTAF